LLGVFDWVKFYEKDYELVGRDATRAFVSGDFSESGLVDNVEGLGYQDLLGVFDWVKFYEKDYELEVVELIDSSLNWKDIQAEETKVFPPCNSEWRKDIGGRVWCSKKSGGIEREWSGVPRKLFDPASKSSR
uniref:Cytochrome b5 heme-binding domain-containing protein n=1 Tax=Gongylonema pulchrum TaxID=637853 RepID=A0A183EJV4_9BILA